MRVSFVAYLLIEFQRLLAFASGFEGLRFVEMPAEIVELRGGALPEGARVFGFVLSLGEARVKKRQVRARIVLLLMFESSGAFEQFARAFDLVGSPCTAMWTKMTLSVCLSASASSAVSVPIDDAVRVVEAPARDVVVDVGTGRVRHGAPPSPSTSSKNSRRALRSTNSSSSSEQSDRDADVGGDDVEFLADRSPWRAPGHQLARALEVAEAVTGERVLQAG